MGKILDIVERLAARYLKDPVDTHDPHAASDPAILQGALKSCDVLLVEGNNRISGLIKYLTQSTWSHAALYVGPIAGAFTETGEPHVLVDANLGEGVVTAPLSKYRQCRTRICRPVGLRPEDRAHVCRYAMDRVGLDYDLKNIIDLARHLLPLPRARRRISAFGSGDPRRIICSALIAQAFETVRYPILPKVTRVVGSEPAHREILESRHATFHAPSDFDNSPYFMVVKPALESGFDHRDLSWADRPAAIDDAQATLVPQLAGQEQPA